MKSLFSYVQKAKRLSREEFLQAHPHPMLVFAPFQPILEELERLETVPGGTSGRGRTPTAVPVRKGERAHAAGAMITIGRAENNDVCVRADAVSKFHAFISISAEEVTLGDAGSTNGTTVRGSPLPPRGRTKLFPGDELAFGALQATFHSPESFWEHLQGLIE